VDAAIWCGIGGWTQEQSDFAIDAWNCYFKNNIATLLSVGLWRLTDAGLQYVGPIGDAPTSVLDWIKNVTSTQNFTVSLNVFADWCTVPGIEWLLDPKNQAIEQMVSAYQYTGAIGIDLDIECDTVPDGEFLVEWLSWQSNLSQALGRAGGVLQGAVDYWELDPNVPQMVDDYYRLVTMSTYLGNHYSEFVDAAKLFQNRVGIHQKAAFAIDVCSFQQTSDICTVDPDVLSNMTQWVGTQAPTGVWVWGQNTIYPQLQDAFYYMLNGETLPISKQCPGELPGGDLWDKYRREQRPYLSQPRR